MYLLLVFLPLIGSLSAGLFGRYLGTKGSQIVTTSCLGAASVLSWYAFMEVGISGNTVYIDLFTWLDSEMLHASLGF
jgi:NADH-ubiquinone oxidoreductase chain 5